MLVIEKSLSQYTKIRIEEIFNLKNASDILKNDLSDLSKKLHVYDSSKDPKEILSNKENVQNISRTNKDSSANTNDIGKQDQLPIKYTSVKEKIKTIGTVPTDIPKIELSEKDKNLLRKLELEYEKEIKKQEVSKVKQSDESLGETTSAKAIQNINYKQIPRPNRNYKPKDMVSIIILLFSIFNFIKKISFSFQKMQKLEKFHPLE
jgi:hypothetical protein